jgi:hypothetical protein
MRIIAAFVFVCLLCVSASAQEQISMQDFSDGCRDWDSSNLRSAWESDPGRVSAIDERVHAFLQTSAAYWAGSDWAKQSKPSRSDRLKTADSLLGRAPDSIVLRLLRAENLLQDNIGEHYPEFLATHNAAKEFSGLPVRRMYIAALVNAHASEIDDAVVMKDTSDYAGATLREVLVGPPADQMHQRYLVFLSRSYIKYCNKNFDLSASASKAGKTSADPWVALMIEGLAHKQIAWSVRGRGYGYTVTLSQQATFNDRMAQASVPLTRAYNMRRESPEAAAAMIDVTKSISDNPDEIAMWFRRVISAQVAWMPAVDEYMWAIRPRWHGSVGQMARLSSWIAVEALRSEDLRKYFFRAVEMIGEDAGSYRYIWLDDELAESARALLSMQIQSGTEPDVALQRLLGIAWARGEWEEAADILTQLGDQQSWSPLQHFRVHYQRVADDVVLGNERDSRMIQIALEEEIKGDRVRAAELFALATGSEGFDERVAEALRRRAVSSKWNLDYHEGKRVVLAAESDLPGWRLWRGSAEARDGVMLVGGGGGSTWLVPDLDPGPRYEMTLTCRMPPGAGKAWSRVLIGHNWRTEYEQWHTVALRWHDAKGRMRFRYESLYSNAVTEPLEDGVVSLRIVCYDGSLLVIADDELLYRGPLTMGIDYRPGTEIAFSTWVDGKGRASAFENITLQRLDERPSELDGKRTKTFDNR